MRVRTVQLLAVGLLCATLGVEASSKAKGAEGKTVRYDGHEVLEVARKAKEAEGEKVRYDGYDLLEAVPTRSRHMETFKNILQEFDVWKIPRGLYDTAHVLVPPQKKEMLENLLRTEAIAFNTKIRNVQNLLDNEEVALRNGVSKMEWTQYHRLNEIYKWLDEVAANFSFVKTIVGGTSYEKRPIRGLEITFGKNLTGVFIEAGIHAREWASPASTTWIINEIIRSPENSVFRKFNYIYFPVLNPDGYEFAWTKNRLWRKTRTLYSYQGIFCFGADPNRNWDYHWNGVGSSNNPCSEIYAGPKAFSEVEIKSMSEFIKKVKVPKKIDIFFTFHTYSQLLLYPWSDTKAPSPHKPLWDKMGLAASRALKAVHNQTLGYGQSSVLLYETSGSSDDYFYGIYNISVSFTFEMRDKGKHGFVLPPEQIIPNAQEYMAASEAVLTEYLKNKYVFQN